MRRGLPTLVAFALVAGCGGDDEPRAASTATPNPTVEATPAPAGSAANAFIGSIAIDPADGTMLLGTGLGLFRHDGPGRKARRVVGQLSTPDGSGPVSSNLVVRFAGPGELLASGHPEGGGSALPENLGLMRSRDHGRTWETVAELGRADYHVLQAAGDRLVAVHAEDADIQVSRDGGRSFESRRPPEPPVDVAFDGARMVVATEQGVYASADEGRSWRQADVAPSEQLAWARPDALYRADPGGAIKVSADGGRTWEDAGGVGMPVSELAADADGALYAAVAGGEVRRSTDGGATWERYLRLQ